MDMYGGISKLYNIRGMKTEQSDVSTYGGISKIYFIQIHIYLFFCFTDKVHGTKIQQSDVATYGGRIHVYIYFRVCFEQSTMAMYGGIPKLFIIHIHIYLFFCFTDKVREKKRNTLMWLRMGGEFMSTYVFAYGYLANVSSLDCG